VGDLLTPIIAAIFGKPNFSDLYFTINNSQFLYGGFLDALITFVSVAAAVFLFVVKPVNAMVAARARGQGDSDPTIKQCPECLSEIPVAASRCAYCTQAQPAIA
jgi:large conductance mechanosensitive channel